MILFDIVLNSKNNGIFVYAVEPSIIKILANLRNLNFSIFTISNITADLKNRTI
jgi:hypothetical protein